MTGLLTASRAYKPFRYPWAYDFWQRQQLTHWMPEEVPLADDCGDWNKKLTDNERQLLTQLFRFFTQSDIDVGANYMENYMPLFKPVEVRMMLAAFSNMETVHIAAYALLLETIGMPETEFSAFLEYEQMQAKHDYLGTFGTDTPEDILTSMAVFGAFTEGLQLFASFAMLLNFPRFGKMKGMGQVVSWSVRDECVTPETEVLTPTGWKAISEISDQEWVAQFNAETRAITFVNPDRVVRKPYKGVMHKFSKRHLSLVATPNHDIIHYNEGAPTKIKASEFNPHPRRKIPTAGFLKSETHTVKSLTPLQRILIAYAADGCKVSGENRTGERAGYQRVTFWLKKQEKIDRLRELCRQADIRYNVLSQDDIGRLKITVDLPAGLAHRTMSDWVDISDTNSDYCHQFIAECLLWDGYVREGRAIFCSTNKRDIGLLQALTHLSGWSSTLVTSVDDRKETYKDYYRLSIWDQMETPSGNSTNKSEVEYDGMVYCVSVPDQNFLIRHEGKVSVTGNSLHCEGMIKLFHTYAAEIGGVSPAARERIVECCRQVVMMEDKFIDLAFEAGEIEGMTPHDIKQYIRYIADWRLGQLGLTPIYGIERHPLPWLTEILNGVEHANFFEARATEYSKASTTGDWGDAFD